MRLLLIVAALLALPMLAISAPADFREAKEAMRYVYADHRETLYCGCKFSFVGRSGAGRTDLESCGYTIRKQPKRAQRIEWEHVVPAYNFGRQRPCWREGGRDHCKATDPVFVAMEADMFNLVPAVGEVNADRSYYRFALLPDSPPQHGACPFRVDFGQRKAEPPVSARGLIARTYFYMHDRYDLRMSRQQEQLMMAWAQAHPVTDWERTRQERIAQEMGHSNEFITGKQLWVTGYEPRGDGVNSQGGGDIKAASAGIRGNKRSKIYHLPEGCPSYDMMAPHNVVEFDSVESAIRAGYRKAGNCR